MSTVLDPQKKPDLLLIRGDSKSIGFSVSGIDLTGKTVFFTVKPILGDDDPADSEAVISKEITSHDNPTAGHTIIALSKDDTDITPGEYYYDIQIADGDAITSIPVRKLKVFADVTRRTT